MNKQFFLKSFIAVFCLSVASAASANVVASGNWSDSAVWSDGVVPPATSAENPYKSFIIDSSNISLNVNSNQWVEKIQLGTSTNTVINIESGKTFTVNGTLDAPKNFLTSSSADNTLKFTGDGTLYIGYGSASDRSFDVSKITYDVNVKTNSSGNLLFLKDSPGGVFNINKGFDMGYGQLNMTSWTINLGSTAVMKAGYLITFGKFNMAQGATADFTSGGSVSNLNTDGAITFAGVRNYQYEKFAIKLGGTNIIGATGSLKTTATSVDARNIFGGTLTSSAAVNAINLGGTMFINNGGSLVLNSSNAIKVGAAAGQGTSTFNVVSYSTVSQDTVWVDKFAASTASITLGANNDFGKFVFYNDSQLTINVNGKSSTIGGIGIFDKAVGSNYKIILDNLTDFTIRLNSLDNVTTYEEDGGLRAEEILFNDADGYSSKIFLVSTGDGGWWLNTSVPEPAEVAAILGAFALAVALIRRRNAAQ